MIERTFWILIVVPHRFPNFQHEMNINDYKWIGSFVDRLIHACTHTDKGFQYCYAKYLIVNIS